MSGQCPTCSGSGYNGRGDYCATCGGTGEYVPLTVPVARDPWLYLPAGPRWINPTHIVAIVPSGNPESLDSGYTLILTTRDLDISGFDIPDDVAAVTAWLEARS